MNKHIKLFDRIAHLYKFFFKYQRRKFEKFIEKLDAECSCNKMLDIGFGTGALLKTLRENGKEVHGIDGSKRMHKIASKKVSEIKDNLIQGDLTKGLPYADNTFDCVVSSYVVHGLNSHEREIYYTEAKRVSKNSVILYEHSKKPNFIVKIAEFLEGGEYFRFRKHVDMELEKHFKTIKRIHFSKSVTIYIMKL